MVPLPDVERAESLGRLGLHRDTRDHSQARPAPRPVNQVLHVVGRPFEDRLDPAIGQIPYPPTDTPFNGQPPARVPEVHPLDPPRDQHPVPNHSQTVLRDPAGGRSPKRFALVRNRVL
jgi:hypothetical protein